MWKERLVDSRLRKSECETNDSSPAQTPKFCEVDEEGGFLKVKFIEFGFGFAAEIVDRPAADLVAVQVDS
jgi:hypothetical protein